MEPGGTAGRAPLDRATIVAGGIELADEGGVDQLTMRRLAGRLGFKAMALYNHVASKDELLTLMVDAVAAEVGDASTADEPLERLRAHAIETRRALVRHPWASGIWLRYLPGPARVDHMELMLRLLAESGLPHDLAHHGFHAVNNHVLGYTLQAQAMDFDESDQSGLDIAEQFVAGLSAETHPRTIAHVHEHLNGETTSSFELVLDLVLDGLVRRAEDARS